MGTPLDISLQYKTTGAYWTCDGCLYQYAATTCGADPVCGNAANTNRIQAIWGAIYTTWTNSIANGLIQTNVGPCELNTAHACPYHDAFFGCQTPCYVP